MRSQSTVLILATLLSLLAAQPAAAQTTIDTYPLWDSSNTIFTWGGGGTPTYGQSFTADATHAVLTQMRFSLSGDGIAQNFRAYVFQWTGSDTIGPALFTSSSLFYDGSSTFQNVDVSTGALALTPGLQYVALYSSVGEDGGVTASWGYLGSGIEDGVDGDVGGNFVFNNSQGFVGEWENPTYFGGQPSHDLAFRLTFAAVPEPTTWLLIGVGVMGCTVSTWRYRLERKRQLEASLHE